MADENIEKARKILQYRRRSDLAVLLQYSISNIDVSSTYGSCLFSVLSTFEIYSPLENHEQLSHLNENDKKTILDAVIEIFPPRKDSPEINEIQFYVNMDIKPGHKIISCKGISESGGEYINEQILKCEEKIMNCDYDGAITNARTLVESVCLFILEKSKISYKSDGNLIKLHKKVYEVLKMDPALYPYDCFKQILSGVISIINGLSNLRNVMGDAHARSERKDYKPNNRHALLAVNIAKVISEFLYTSWKGKNT